jgi:hypothetical protein
MIYEQIKMHLVRKAALELMGQTYTKANYDKLPAEFSTGPVVLYWGSFEFRVMSQAEAKEFSKTTARRPHRILVWDQKCGKWMYAGKYMQHRRIVHLGIKPRNQNRRMA